MNMPNRIKSVRWVEGYRIKLVFGDGFVAALDLTTLTEAPRGPLEVPLKDVEFFKQVRCDESTIYWPNRYDLCPDVLRYWSESGRVCSQAETDLFFKKIFSQKESALILNEKSP